MSVRETTPVSRPEILAPGKAAAETGKDPESDGEVGVDEFGECRLAKPMEGVAPGDGEGEDDSTTHIRWDLVASILAIVWPSVE